MAILSFVTKMFADEVEKHNIHVVVHGEVETDQFFRTMDLNDLLKDSLDAIMNKIHVFESVRNDGIKYKGIVLPDNVESAYRTMLLVSRLAREGYVVFFATKKENGFSQLLTA